MPRLPIVTAKQLISVPVHQGKTLGKGLTVALLKDAGISRDEFLRLL